MSKDTGFYRKKGDSIEHVEIVIRDDDGEEFDMETLREIFKGTIDKQKDKLEKIIDFGASILGDHYRGTSFMMGWVVNKILMTYEIKNDTKLHVTTEAEVLDKEELTEKTVDMLEDLLEKIKSGDIDLEDMPINMKSVDGDYE